MKLNDSFKISGQDLKSFEDHILEIDEMTYLKTFKSFDTDILSLIKEDDDFLYFSVLPSIDNVKKIIEERKLPKTVRLAKDQIDDETLVEEIRSNGILLRTGGEIYLTSSNLMQTLLQRIGLGQKKAAFEPSIERDCFLARCFGTDEFIMNALVRQQGLNKKIFAVFSDRYVREEQNEVMERINLLTFSKPCGNILCEGWEITNLKTSISLSFPEKEYKGFVPGICYQTSDTGTVSTKVFGLINFHGMTIPLEEYCVPHRKGYDFFDMIEEYEAKVFEDNESFLRNLEEATLSKDHSTLPSLISKGLGVKPGKRIKSILNEGDLIDQYKGIIDFLKENDFGDVNTQNILKKLGEYPATISNKRRKRNVA